MQWQRIIRGKLFTLFQYRKRYGLHAMKKHTNSLLVFHRFNTASGMDCMQSVRKSVVLASSLVSIPQAVWIACNNIDEVAVEKVESAVSIPQAVWIACNEKAYKFSPCFPSFQYRKRYGLHAIPSPKGRGVVAHWGFNTASGMDCMQYRPSQPLGQLNPEAGFLNGSLFWTNRRNPAGFFCRQNRLKTSANPVISRKLLSTGKI